MMVFLEAQLLALRPAFMRQDSFVWFVVAFAGVVTRHDVYGVSSIIRALSLVPAYYPALLHFFASVKNLLGGLAYHFSSKYLAPVSRRPTHGHQPAPISSRPERTRNTLANLLHANIRTLAKNPVTQFILRKQTSPQKTLEKQFAFKRKAA